MWVVVKKDIRLNEINFNSLDIMDAFEDKYAARKRLAEANEVNSLMGKYEVVQLPQIKLTIETIPGKW